MSDKEKENREKREDDYHIHDKMVADGASLGALLETGVEVVFLAVGLVVDLVEAFAAKGATARVACETATMEEVTERLRRVPGVCDRLVAVTTRPFNSRSSTYRPYYRYEVANERARLRLRILRRAPLPHTHSSTLRPARCQRAHPSCCPTAKQVRKNADKRCGPFKTPRHKSQPPAECQLYCGRAK